MYSSQTQGLKLCDYVTLTLGSATTTTDNTYTWNIRGNGYYSNRRSHTCTVEISSGVIDRVTAGDGSFLVQYVNGGHNQYNSTQERPVIGMSDVISSNDQTTDVSHSIKSTGSLLCDPRPGEITLKVTKLDNGIVGALSGAITLKYAYYNSVESAEILRSEYTPVRV